jgi:hypothetical protein
LPKHANNYQDCDKSAFLAAKKFRNRGGTKERASRMKPWRWFAIDHGGRIADPAALEDFMAREASLVAQKTIVDYVHMKTRLALNEFTREKAFTEAFDAGRAASYAAVLADLAAVVEAHLRAPAGARAGALPAALARVYARCLARFDVPVPPAPERAPAALERRLAQLQLAAPKSSADIAITCGNALFDLLPIHPSLRKEDREPVVEGARFLFMSRCQRLDRRLQAAALLPALFADAPDGARPASV